VARHVFPTHTQFLSTWLQTHHTFRQSLYICSPISWHSNTRFIQQYAVTISVIKPTGSNLRHPLGHCQCLSVRQKAVNRRQVLLHYKVHWSV
jgi:hypothetical protein